MTRTRWLYALGVTVTALLAGLAWRVSFAPEFDFYSPEAYNHRANQFIRNGFLVADCSGDSVRLTTQLERATDVDRAWFEDSYLARDVARFNEERDAFGWAFLIDESCHLQSINPTIHTVELPFPNRPRWSGSIFFGGGALAAALRSVARTITLRHPQDPVPARDETATAVGSTQAIPNAGAVLLHFGGSAGRPAGRVYHVGPDVVINNRVRANDEQVRLLGRVLPRGTIAALRTGDWLKFSTARPQAVDETFIFVGSETREEASTIRHRNDRLLRQTKETGLGAVSDAVSNRTYPFLDLVVEAIANSLGQTTSEAARKEKESFDLELSIRRDLQERLSTRLAEYVDSTLRARGLHDTVVPAAITVMDGLSGDLLALATYPGRAALASNQVLDGRSRRRLLQNQNLLLHPIGSAGKPFLFAAIADAHPFLTSLVIPGHAAEEQRRQVFQCELTQGYQVLGSHGYSQIDFRTALEISSNRYTVELATLALAASERPGSGAGAGPLRSDASASWPRPTSRTGITIQGRELNFAPDLSGYLVGPALPTLPGTEATRRCDALDRVEYAPFREPLERLTGAATLLGRTPVDLPANTTDEVLERGYTNGRYDLSLWSPLINHLGTGLNQEATWAIRAAVQPLAPERVNLAFNQVSQFREDFVTMLLGGGHSSWTNVQLAEAMSRLVTGRRVQARLGSRILEPGKASVDTLRQLTDSLPIAPLARRTVLEGIARVVEGGGGTAQALRAELATVRAAFPGERIDFFSKTGSPTVMRPVPPITGRVLTELVERGALAIENAALVAGPPTGRIRYTTTPGVDREAFFQALGRAAQSAILTRQWAFASGSIERIIDEFAEQIRAGVALDALQGPLKVRSMRLWVDQTDDLFRRRLVRDKGAMYMLTLVRRPRAQSIEPTSDELLDRRTRVITVVVYLAFGPDSGVAVDATAAILPDLLTLLH